MSTTNGGMESRDGQRQRGWWGQNWRWFVPTAFLLVVLIGGAAAYWALFVRVRSLEVYQSAMRSIQSDPVLRVSLGEPIQAVSWPPPSAELNAEEKILWWEVAGPKGHGKAHLRATPIAGKWEIRLIEVDGKRVSQEGEGSDEAPRFDGPAAGPAKQESVSPAPQINLPIPPDAGPGK